ncbi:3-dehydroquinate dehydratase [Prosthecobacter fusiformis]|uniref:3-dehydroquinate dehydratase n=1 Tax=Prosthecobacter fusiformis TaxID=48464 RepID=A0A4R7SSV3_9BACT|nr:type I 3-dehydroquinate dehydratase [Prosthecobacter fusiformis]TDU81769.1 3-dehydroquinate dehydratase [Prosthecobacter fusiformis]
MPQLLSSSNLLLSSRPLAVGVIPDPATLQFWSSLSPAQREASCDVIELRLDTLKTPAADIRAALSGNTVPILLTARHPAEGGQGTEDAAGRIAMIEPLLDLAVLIDIELRSAMDMRPLVQKAQGRGVRVIGSFHDFQTTPGEEVLRGAINFAQPAGLDAVKLATFLNTSADLTRLITLTSEVHRLRLSTMGMGPLGRVSRLVLAKCGSLLNYGYLGQANAPGQWPAARLKELLAEL